MKRLKRAKYIAEHIDQLRDQLSNLLQPSLIDLLSSDKIKDQFSLFLSTNDENSSTTTTTTIDDRKEFLEQIEQLSCLDQIIIPEDDTLIDEHFTDQFDQ